MTNRLLYIRVRCQLRVPCKPLGNSRHPGPGIDVVSAIGAAALSAPNNHSSFLPGARQGQFKLLESRTICLGSHFEWSMDDKQKNWRLEQMHFLAGRRRVSIIAKFADEA